MNVPCLRCHVLLQVTSHPVCHTETVGRIADISWKIQITLKMESDELFILGNGRNGTVSLVPHSTKEDGSNSEFLMT